MTIHEQLVDSDHPLAQELRSLRYAVERYQREAYTTSVQLQRYSLEVSNAAERCRLQEAQNIILKKELSVLRSNPDIQPHQDTVRVQELTLALRRLSEKLDATDNVLFERNMELAQALSDREKAFLEAEHMRSLVHESRSKEHDHAKRVRELLFLLDSARHEKEMAHLVIQDYAELVKSYERKNDTGSMNGKSIEKSLLPTIQKFEEGKHGLQKLLEEHNAEKSRLEVEILRLQEELDDIRQQLEVEQQCSLDARDKLCTAQVELERLKMDDSTAAKMVSRYMKFSQSSADILHAAMANLKLRHETILAGMEAQLHQLEASASSAAMRTERLRHTLDELTEDISRESYGRRREISLRLAQISREERIINGLEQWGLKAEQLLSTISERVPEAFRELFAEASTFLNVLGNKTSEEVSGSLARLIVAEDMVAKLGLDLQRETDRRLELERHKFSDKVHETAKPKRPDAAQSDGPQSIDSTAEESTRKERISEGTQTDDLSATTTLVAPHEQSTYVGLSQPHSSDDYSVEDTIFVPFPVTERSENTLSPGTGIMTDDVNEPNSLIVDAPEQSLLIGAAIMTDSASGIPPSPNLSQSSTDIDALVGSLSQSVVNRYEIFQKGFRDCHLALQNLRQQYEYIDTEGSRNILNAILSRLDDFNEDARVEVEIRISDEERIATGYETLLAISQIHQNGDENTLRSKILAFVEGSDESTRKSMLQIQTKLEDIQHDIASVKQAIHEGSLPNSAINGLGWTSWTAGLLSSPRPASPSPSRSRTFGTVITSPRLRTSSTSRRTSDGVESDILASLQLRIPVPMYYPTAEKPSLRSRTSSLMYSLGIGNRDHALARVSSASSATLQKADSDYNTRPLGDEEVE